MTAPSLDSPRSCPGQRRWPWRLGPHLAVLVILSWLPLSYFRMVDWPWLGLWQGGFLALLVGLILRLRQLQRPFLGLGHGLDSWLLALGAVLALSSLASPFPRVALWNTSVVIAYALGLYAYRNEVDHSALTRRRLWLGLVAVAAGVALISLALGWPEVASLSSQDFFTALRNHQPLGHHNFVGGYLGLTLPLAVAAALALSGPGRWAAAGAVGLITTALYLSGSRGAALGFIVWLVGAWAWGLGRAHQDHRWRWGLMGVVPLGAMGLALGLNPRLRGWFSMAGAADGPTLDRWFMLRLGGNILADRPWVGVGPGVMSRMSNLYRPIETGAGLDHIQQLHNTPVQIAGELGLPGLILYLAGLFWLGRRLWQLWQLPLATADRHLLGGIGGAFVAYGVSSLTDYQLENIPISGTLVALVVLLISLADAYGLPSRTILPAHRRLASLVVWAGVGLLVYLWLPFALTVGLGAQAKAAFDRQAVNLADTRWHQATLLSPWDPTAAAMASESFQDLSELLGDSEAKVRVRALAVDYAQQAQAAAPNDVWFNQNLAVLYQPDDPAQALTYAQRSVQILPRHRHYGYWLLGELLLATDQAAQAIAAFTLEALVNPASLTYPLWQSPPLQAIYPAVVSATLAEYDHLLAEVNASDPGYGVLYETRAVLGWWVGQPLASLDTSRLRPFLPAVFWADTDPAAALAHLESLIATDAPPPALLMAAWLDPDTHWPAYTQNDLQAGGSLTLDTLRLADTLAIQPLRSWLTSLPLPPDRSYRGGLAFAYRNAQAQAITQMLAPPSLETHLVIRKLGLFQPWPREFPALDQRLESLKTTALGLAHPTVTGRYRALSTGQSAH
ncbi:O-antigen ligase family protein [Leptolyngbya sp. BL0902]|uniref:O-antigen ligase family protein n=1 Tax=Leptolyngbya sp. BL0902 TaxID=1115757 RepID=UPI0018E730B7|nr:O-antigen ligase family protein [Leptolyngbya sp. BL0902]